MSYVKPASEILPLTGRRIIENLTSSTNAQENSALIVTTLKDFFKKNICETDKYITFPIDAGCIEVGDKKICDLLQITNPSQNEQTEGKLTLVKPNVKGFSMYSMENFDNFNNSTIECDKRREEISHFVRIRNIEEKIEKSLSTLKSDIYLLVEMMQNSTGKIRPDILQQSYLVNFPTVSDGETHIVLLLALPQSNKENVQRYSNSRCVQRNQYAVNKLVIDEDIRSKNIRYLQDEIYSLKKNITYRNHVMKLHILKPLPDELHLRTMMKESAQKVDQLTKLWLLKWLCVQKDIPNKKTQKMCNEEKSHGSSGSLLNKTKQNCRNCDDVKTDLTNDTSFPTTVTSVVPNNEVSDISTPFTFCSLKKKRYSITELDDEDCFMHNSHVPFENSEIVIDIIPSVNHNEVNKDIAKCMKQECIDRALDTVLNSGKMNRKFLSQSLPDINKSEPSFHSLKCVPSFPENNYYGKVKKMNSINTSLTTLFSNAATHIRTSRSIPSKNIDDDESEHKQIGCEIINESDLRKLVENFSEKKTETELDNKNTSEISYLQNDENCSVESEILLQRKKFQYTEIPTKCTLNGNTFQKSVEELNKRNSLSDNKNQAAIYSNTNDVIQHYDNRSIKLIAEYEKEGSNSNFLNSENDNYFQFNDNITRESNQIVEFLNNVETIYNKSKTSYCSSVRRDSDICSLLSFSSIDTNFYGSADNLLNYMSESLKNTDSDGTESDFNKNVKSTMLFNDSNNLHCMPKYSKCRCSTSKSSESYEKIEELAYNGNYSSEGTCNFYKFNSEKSTIKNAELNFLNSNKNVQHYELINLDEFHLPGCNEKSEVGNVHNSTSELSKSSNEERNFTQHNTPTQNKINNTFRRKHIMENKVFETQNQNSTTLENYNHLETYKQPEAGIGPKSGGGFELTKKNLYLFEKELNASKEQMKAVNGFEEKDNSSKESVVISEDILNTANQDFEQFYDELGEIGSINLQNQNKQSEIIMTKETNTHCKLTSKSQINELSNNFKNPKGKLNVPNYEQVVNSNRNDETESAFAKSILPEKDFYLTFELDKDETSTSYENHCRNEPCLLYSTEIPESEMKMWADKYLNDQNSETKCIDDHMQHIIDNKVNQDRKIETTENCAISSSLDSLNSSSDSITYIFVGKDQNQDFRERYLNRTNSLNSSLLSLDSLEKSFQPKTPYCSPRTLSIDSLVAEELLKELCSKEYPSVDEYFHQTFINNDKLNQELFSEKLNTVLNKGTCNNDNLTADVINKLEFPNNFTSENENSGNYLDNSLSTSIENFNKQTKFQMRPQFSSHLYQQKITEENLKNEFSALYSNFNDSDASDTFRDEKLKSQELETATKINTFDIKSHSLYKVNSDKNYEQTAMALESDRKSENSLIILPPPQSFCCDINEKVVVANKSTQTDYFSLCDENVNICTKKGFQTDYKNTNVTNSNCSQNTEHLPCSIKLMIQMIDLIKETIQYLNTTKYDTSKYCSTSKQKRKKRICRQLLYDNCVSSNTSMETSFSESNCQKDKNFVKLLDHIQKPVKAMGNSLHQKIKYFPQRSVNEKHKKVLRNRKFNIRKAQNVSSDLKLRGKNYVYHPDAYYNDDRKERIFSDMTVPSKKNNKFEEKASAADLEYTHEGKCSTSVHKSHNISNIDNCRNIENERSEIQQITKFADEHEAEEEKRKNNANVISDLRNISVHKFESNKEVTTVNNGRHDSESELLSLSSTSEGYLSSSSSHSFSKECSNHNTSNDISDTSVLSCISVKSPMTWQKRARHLKLLPEYSNEGKPSNTRWQNVSADSGAFFMESPGSERKDFFDLNLKKDNEKSCERINMIKCKEKDSLSEIENIEEEEEELELLQTPDIKTLSTPLHEVKSFWKDKNESLRFSEIHETCHELEEIDDEYLVSSPQKNETYPKKVLDYDFQTKAFIESLSQRNFRVTKDDIKTLIASIEADKEFIRRKRKFILDRSFSPLITTLPSSDSLDCDISSSYDTYKCLPDSVLYLHRTNVSVSSKA